MLKSQIVAKITGFNPNWQGNSMSDKSKTYLFIINDAPYGNERPYNALRLAMDLVKLPEVHVQVFLMGDGVNCALAGQKTPDGYYNVERMLKSIARQRPGCYLRKSCVEARGIGPERYHRRRTVQATCKLLWRVDGHGRPGVGVLKECCGKLDNA